MNEVEKMYENANMETLSHCCDDTCGEPTKRCKDCPDYREIYPPFTAEKQIELFKLIANRLGYPDYEYFGTLLDDYVQVLNFDEALAKIVNNLWQDLTDTERKQIKEILE